jgi:hypothetical protein
LQLTDLLFLVPEKIIALPWALSGYGINFYPREVQPRPSAEPREYREVGELGRGSSLLLLQFVRDPFDVVRKLGCVVSTAYVSVPMSWLCGIRSNCFGLGRRPYVFIRALCVGECTCRSDRSPFIFFISSCPWHYVLAIK